MGKRREPAFDQPDDCQLRLKQCLPIMLVLLLMIQLAATAQTGEAMLYVATYFDIQLPATDQGIALIKQYRDAGRTEQGNSSIDVVQEIGRPNRFVIIEFWKDQSSLEAHERAERTAQFRTKIKAIHNSPFDEREHHGFATDPHRPAGGRDMVSVVTHVDVPPQQRNEA